MKNQSSRNTRTFPDLAIPRADALNLKFTRKSVGLLRATQARNQPTLVHMELRQQGEDGGCAAATAARIFVGAYGLRGARMRGEGEGVSEEEGARSDDAQRTRGGRGRGRRCRRGSEARHGQGEAAWTWRCLRPLLLFGSRRHFQHQRAESVPVVAPTRKLENLKTARVSCHCPTQRSLLGCFFSGGVVPRDCMRALS
jgi:hypothetical protein